MTRPWLRFGRNFIPNLDLPLNSYDRSSFYDFDSKGYTDYPFYDAEANPYRAA
jgi:N-ethylmaleimide reductase